MKKGRGGRLRVCNFFLESFLGFFASFFLSGNKMNESNYGGRGPFVPTFDGKGSSFLDFEQRVALWNRTTDIPAD